MKFKHTRGQLPIYIYSERTFLKHAGRQASTSNHKTVSVCSSVCPRKILQLRVTQSDLEIACDLEGLFPDLDEADLELMAEGLERRQCLL